MNNVLVIDANKCTGCLSCAAVCSMLHEGASSLALSRVQVISDEPRGIHVPMMCRHCEDAPCVAVCPTKAMAQSRSGGQVLLDYSRCIGCRYCAQACPFGAIGLDPQTMKIIKCDLCDGNPACARFCQPQAIGFVPATKAALGKRKAEAQKVADSMVQA